MKYYGREGKKAERESPACLCGGGGHNATETRGERRPPLTELLKPPQGREAAGARVHHVIYA